MMGLYIYIRGVYTFIFMIYICNSKPFARWCPHSRSWWRFIGDAVHKPTYLRGKG